MGVTIERMGVTGAEKETLHVLAGKYVWWRPPEEAIEEPQRILAGTMNIGTLEDYRLILRVFGTTELAQVLEHAAPGWFQPKSWSFWHRLLGLTAPTGTPPPLPERRIR